MNGALCLLILLAAQPAHATGNGGLTVEIGESGGLRSCRWPGPGHPEQLGPVPTGWMLRADGILYDLRLPGPHASQVDYADSVSVVVLTRTEIPEAGLHLEQTAFVHPAMDLLVVQLRIQGGDTAPDVFWLADFSPCTRPITGLPLASDTLKTLGDFATIPDPEHGVVYHFRPGGPGRAEWDQAQEYAARSASVAEWEELGEGDTDDGRAIWVGIASGNEAATLGCGLAKDGVLLADRIAGGPPAPTSPVIGDGHSMIGLVPTQEGGGWVASVLVAFGHDQQGVRATLDQARGQDVQTLREEVQQHWQHWFDGCSFSGSETSEADRQRRALRAIALATDRATGAILCAPAEFPQIRFDSPRLGALPTLVYGLAGRVSDAERHLRFYAEAVCRESQSGMPRGSLPGALSAAGTPIASEWVVDLDASAWFLCAVWRHAQLLEPDVRTAFLQSVVESVGHCTDFVAGWTEGTRGAPLHAFQPRLLRDGRSEQSQLLAYLAVECAVQIGEQLGREIDGAWERRRDDLAALLRFGVLNQEAPWVLDRWLPYWTQAVLQESHAEWVKYRATSQTVSRLWDARIRVEAGERLLGDPVMSGEEEAAPLEANAVPDAYRAAEAFLSTTLR